MDMAKTVTIAYFALIREQIGTSSEQVELPQAVVTVGELVAWLRARGPEFEQAFSDDAAVRVALDFSHVDDANAPLADVAEIAFFPPMTGG